MGHKNISTHVQNHRTLFDICKYRPTPTKAYQVSQGTFLELINPLKRKNNCMIGSTTYKPLNCLQATWSFCCHTSPYHCQPQPLSLPPQLNQFLVGTFSRATSAPTFPFLIFLAAPQPFSELEAPKAPLEPLIPNPLVGPTWWLWDQWNRKPELWCRMTWTKLS